MNISGEQWITIVAVVAVAAVQIFNNKYVLQTTIHLEGRRQWVMQLRRVATEFLGHVNLRQAAAATISDLETRRDGHVEELLKLQRESNDHSARLVELISEVQVLVDPHNPNQQELVRLLVEFTQAERGNSTQKMRIALLNQLHTVCIEKVPD